MTPTIGLTSGCPAGVGPEVLVAALATLPAAMATLPFVFFGSRAVLHHASTRVGVAASASGTDTFVIHHPAGPVTVSCRVADDIDPAQGVVPGVVSAAALVAQRQSLVSGCQAAARGEVQALVTAPVRKTALVIDGVTWPGQTEVCHHHLALDDDPPLMVFAGGPFLLGLFTVHVPLRAVADLVTAQGLQRALLRLRDAARRLAPRQGEPRLAVFGVNPHAGEQGLLGHEEGDVVEPLLQQLRGQGWQLNGPLPADGFFADVARHQKACAAADRTHSSSVVASGLPVQFPAPPPAIDVDAVLAMHHDQGLAPYKLLVGGEGINITWGLRVPRTSPDHGTADALAGTGRADPSSMRQAIVLAHRLAS